MSTEEQRRVNRRCTVGMPAGWERGMQQGMQQKEYSSIRNLMETMNLSAKQAMDALRVPEADRAKYAELLKQ